MQPDIPITPKPMIDFVQLDKRIKDEKRVLVIAPRRSGATEALQLEIELTRARKPWLYISYKTMDNEASKRFTAFNPPLGNGLGTYAVFIDQMMATSMEKIREMVCNTAIQQITIFSTGFIDENSLIVRELKDYGFRLVNAPMCWVEVKEEVIEGIPKIPKDVNLLG